MVGPTPRIYAAGSREEGVVCPHCREDISRREMVAVCNRCGTTHHEACWNQCGCGSYDCAPASRESNELAPVSMRVTLDELKQATSPSQRSSSLPSGASTAWSTQDLAAAWAQRPRRTSAITIIAFVVSLVAIPLYGVFTGPIAMLLGTVALVNRQPRQRGAVLGACAVLIGFGSFLGWTLYLANSALPINHAGLASDDFQLDAEDFQDQPPAIARALRSNVLIEVHGTGLKGLLERGIGSGVILSLENNQATIVTNRHVVDPDFAHGAAMRQGEADVPDSRVTIKLVGQPRMEGRVVWTAPDGIDLALVVVPVTVPDIAQACWDAKPKLQIGSRVFAVGNPHGLAWTHTGGEISQIRRQVLGSREVRVIQTSAAINPGNSGGGLYDEEGGLIGINTWTQDKRVAEGLGFAISFHALLEMLPETYQLPKERRPTTP